ncbi:MAG TPA: excinuclease ABC subunit UvrA [candidate division Zixibacteria bacterium]|nr:excinuclease ABC subunit UvrA [candidate division Zixibacteria bacterium]
MENFIEIIGAKENNLKNVSVKIPRDQITVVTGVSGSGKSSLAFDVLYAEGQRRFLETLSAYARSRVPQMKRPDVQFIKGLSPIVSIDQRRGISNPRSTIASLTDIGSYMRLLFSVFGEAYCPYCSHKIQIKTSGQLADEINSLPEGAIVEIRSILFKVYGEEYQYLLDQIRNHGYRRFRINNEIHDIGQNIELNEDEDYQIEAIIDKFTVKGDIYKQVIETIENAFYIGQKFIIIEVLNSNEFNYDFNKFYNFTCPNHHTVCGELLPWFFTSNDPESACVTCSGLGTYYRASPYMITKDENKTIREGALDPRILNLSQKTYKRFNNIRGVMMHSIALHYGFSWDTPFKDLPSEIKNIIYYGSNGEKIEIVIPEDAPIQDDKNKGRKVIWEGVVTSIDRWYKRVTKERTPKSYEEDMYKRIMVEQRCPDCKGMKLQKHRNYIKINGKTLHQINLLPIDELFEFLNNLKISDEKKHLADPVLEEIIKRLKVMISIGLGYLNLDRRTDSVSGGELQRTKLSTQIGSELMGLMFVLDEPSIGLHSRDSHKLINVLKEMRDLGNTIIIIEHDIDTMMAADHMIELGPGPGIHGGEIVVQGTIDDIRNNKQSITGQYLSGDKKIAIPTRRRESNGKYLTIKGARENNLRNIDVTLPLGNFVCITGVSGSGKSSLIHEILYKKLFSVFRDRKLIPGDFDAIEGIDNIKDVRNIDQSPIGRSARSNPATYIGFYDKIRRIFTELEESKARGYNVAHFSFNASTGGRCPECSGWGKIITPLQYMADIESICPVCKGARFRKEILEIKYQNKTIADVLDLSVEEALEFFKDDNYLVTKLQVMMDLGLGYLKIGQSSSTISGGEAQRIKLAKELGKIKQEKDNLYILDEPTTGLHLADIQRLLDIINRLVDEGNTVLVIEHNLDVIKTADYVIDLGPEGGKLGGEIVAQGTPEEIAKNSKSYTGKYLRDCLTN